jgi:hypothetical protein
MTTVIILEDINNSINERIENNLKENLEGNYNIIFVRDGEDFRSRLIHAINSGGEFTLFLKGNDFLFKKVNLSNCEDLLKRNQDVFCISLRLGENVTHCHNLNTKNTLHGQKEIEEDCIKWDWTKHYLDFGYPLSCNGHMYRSKDIFKLSTKVNFTDAITYEENLQIFEILPRDYMASFKDSRMVNLIGSEDLVDFTGINSCVYHTEITTSEKE